VKLTDIEGARTPSNGILPGIQYLRGFAAILVVIWHANWLFSLPPSYGYSPFLLAETGLFGVAIFFVISGFIITIISLGSSQVSLGEFVTRRFVRIVPFMWACVIGYNLLSFAGTGKLDVAPALRAMVLWPIGELRPHIVWTLRHELIFYILFALTMLRSRPLPILLAIWFVCPLIWYGAAQLFRPDLIEPQNAMSDLAATTLYGNVMMPNLQFGAGFVLGLLWLKQHPLVRARNSSAFAVTIGMTVISTAIVGLTLSEDNGWRAVYWTLFASIVVWSGIVSFAKPGRLHSLGMLLGNASYSIYLTHNAVLLVLIQASAHAHNPLPAKLFLPLTVILCIGAGIIVHWYVELPLIAYCRRLGRKQSAIA
jgi:exopolysaccharide production protein ExoZ